MSKNREPLNRERPTEPKDRRDKVIGYLIELVGNVHAGEGNCNKLREGFEKALFLPVETVHRQDLFGLAEKEWKALTEFFRTTLQDPEYVSGELKMYEKSDLPDRFNIAYLFTIPEDRYHGRKDKRYLMCIGSGEVVVIRDDGKTQFYDNIREPLQLLDFVQRGSVSMAC
jgi:hypothetical protein